MLNVKITNKDAQEVLYDFDTNAIDAVFTTQNYTGVCSAGESRFADVAIRITRFDFIEKSYYEKSPLLMLLVQVLRENGHDEPEEANSADPHFEEIFRDFMHRGFMREDKPEETP